MKKQIIECGQQNWINKNCDLSNGHVLHSVLSANGINNKQNKPLVCKKKFAMSWNDLRRPQFEGSVGLRKLQELMKEKSVKTYMEIYQRWMYLGSLDDKRILHEQKFQDH